MTLTLGSLFDGSGGFPLAGLNVGITPLWASEIEPFPILVTAKRLPQVKHYGDVTSLDGATLPPVDVLTFGSPCQDLSISGKRQGLDGLKSSLFYQAVRIIKEMRKHSNEQYPRYAIWENVPGALFSNGGADFQAVLTSLAETCELDTPAISVPNLEWSTVGAVVGTGWSLAWRVLDAQYFGVPQRRKRIFVIADFRGQSAPEILFEPWGVSGDTASHSPVRETAPLTVGGCAENRGRAFGINSVHYNTNGRYAYEAEVSKTLDTECNQVNKNQGGMVIVQSPAIARTLTPIECARLQGFPDNWCSDLAIEHPTVQELDRWEQVWAGWNRINGVKPKTRNQVKKWMADPVSDRAQYKMWGNGVALPVIEYLLSRLKTMSEKEKRNEP